MRDALYYILLFGGSFFIGYICCSLGFFYFEDEKFNLKGAAVNIIFVLIYITILTFIFKK